MFPVTQALKAHLTKNGWIKGDENDAAIRAVCAKKLASGEINSVTLKNLCGVTQKSAAKSAGTATVRRPVPAKQAAQKFVLFKGRDGVVRRIPVKANGPARVQNPRNIPLVNSAALDQAVAKGVETTLKKMGLGNNVNKIPSPSKMLNQHNQIRVKGAIESYDMCRKGANYPDRLGYKGMGKGLHPLAGQPAQLAGRTLDHPSAADKAVAQAWFKHCLQSQISPHEMPRWLKMTQHDRDLVLWAAHNAEWTGFIGNSDVAVHGKKLDGFQIKTLLDDSTSGAIEATPYVFDNAIVLLPVLYGELFPFVNTINIAKGRRMKGALMNQPTITSGTAEGTAITPFDTTSMISAFDTTIYPAVGALELGLDLEEDSPVDLGGQIIEYYGLKSMEYLDRVVAYGNGTNEPTGLFLTSGAGNIESDNGAGGPLTVSDFEGLMYGIAKQWRNEPGAMPVFVSNDTMYRRARAIPVGPADERRVFGMNHGSYELLEHPYKVQNNIPNGKIAFCNLRRYRMYRRLGLQVRVETAGRTLALSNTKIIVVRMRFGGQMESGSAVAVMSDAQA